MRILLIAVFVLVLLMSRSAGQTTQPIEPSWGQMIANLADGLTSDPGASLVASLVGDEVPIQALNGGETETRYRLQQVTGGLNVVSTRAYTWPASTVATDLGEDFDKCESMPQSLRRQFIPRGEAEGKRSNATAERWLNNALQPTPRDVIGIIVLWEPQPLTVSLLLGTAPPEAKEPIFVLVKASKAGSGGFRITQVLYGDVRQALN